MAVRGTADPVAVSRAGELASHVVEIPAARCWAASRTEKRPEPCMYVVAA
jgi:hypothetical protein